jgi:hypothetical protein
MKMRHSSQDPNWRTPPPFVAKLALTFPFDVDLAADLASAVVLDSGGFTHYFGPDHPEKHFQNSLLVPWSETGYRCGFLNPPFSTTRIKELKRLFDQLKGGATPEQLVKMQQEYAYNAAQFRIEEWARKAYTESERGFTTIGVFPYAPQTKWFRQYVMGHTQDGNTWRGHAALDYWRLPHRVAFLRPDGEKPGDRGGANVNTCVIQWGPNPGFRGPWVPSGRYWTYRTGRTDRKEPSHG